MLFSQENINNNTLNVDNPSCHLMTYTHNNNNIIFGSEIGKEYDIAVDSNATLKIKKKMNERLRNKDIDYDNSYRNFNILDNNNIISYPVCNKTNRIDNAFKTSGYSKITYHVNIINITTSFPIVNTVHSLENKLTDHDNNINKFFSCPISKWRGYGGEKENIF